MDIENMQNQLFSERRVFKRF